MLWAAFASDALSLGAHWIYNPAKIERLFGRVTGYVDIPADSYHKAKSKGDFTHYGDQALVLLESQKPGGFDLAAFVERWKAMWPGYTGYVDGATKGTLANFSAGMPPLESGSDSNDLAGASRLPAAVYRLDGRPVEELVSAARAQTAMTHADPQVADSAEYFTRVLDRVLRSEPVGAALEAEATRDYPATPVAEWFANAKVARRRGDHDKPSARQARADLSRR